MTLDLDRIPGWLVRLLTDDTVSVDDVRSAALYCSTPAYRVALAQRLEELKEVRP